MRTVRLALRRPGATLALAALLLVVVQVGYGKFGSGVEFFPGGRARLRPGHRPRPRQSLAGREGPLPRRSREARARQAKGLKTVYTRVGEQPQRLERAQRRHHRRHPVRVRRLARRARRRTRSWTASATATADIPGILVEVTAPRAGPPTGKPIQVQLGALDPDAAAGGRQEGRGDARASARTSSDLDDGLPLPGIDWKVQVDKAEAAKYGASPATVGTARATRHQRHQGHRIPAGRQRQGRRHPGALPGGPPQPRPDRRTARADAVGLGADRQFRRARAGAARRLHQPRRRQPRHDGVGQRRAGRADRQGAGGDRRRSSPRPISAPASPGS